MKLILVAALVMASITPAFAEQCVAPDDQEMKDMSTDELSTEFCKAHLISAKRLNEGMENLGRFDPKPFPNADTEFDQCLGRLKKIVSVLAKRGVPEISVPALCKQTRSKPSS
jgi:hypothetical protein